MIKVLIVLFLFVNIIHSQNELDSLMNGLEEKMDKRDFYDRIKEERITNLKALLKEKGISSKSQYFITNKLIEEYEYYSFDESLRFIDRNLNLANAIANDSMRTESNLKLAKILATSGRYTESLEILNRIDRGSMPSGLYKDYYHSYRRCYSELRFISSSQRTNTKYNTLYLAYCDSLHAEISKLDKNSIEYLAVIEQSYRDADNLSKALEINAKRLALAKMGTREYSLVTFNRSYMSRDFDKNKTDQKKLLILSAISDIQNSIKDNASLTELAKLLFEEGYVERAHKYINFALEDAKFYNSKLRFLNISEISPEISNSFEARIQEQRNKLEKQLVFISILSLILIIALFFIIRQYKKMKLAKRDLKIANTRLKDLNEELILTNTDLKRLYEELSDVDYVKEQYIGTFLHLYSEYIDKLDVYRKKVFKYISTNKINDLFELTKSRQIINSELRLFYTNFDKSFLHIYPSFVENVNTLLKPDQQIVVNDAKSLNTELRILALIRLGIINSSKISKILRYSVNTIYNYRVKLRNSAVNRNEFEDLVKKIV